MFFSFWKAQSDTCAGAAGSRRAEAAAVSSPGAFPDAAPAHQLVPLLCPQLGGVCSVSLEPPGAAQSTCEGELKMLVV